MKVFAVIFLTGSLYESLIGITTIYSSLTQIVASAGIAIFIWELSKSEFLYVPVNKILGTKNSALANLGLGLAILGSALHGLS